MTNPQPELHPSIVAMIALASGISANHPAMGQCQLKKLRDMGVPENQIGTVIEIARHIRDEAAEKLDIAFDQSSQDTETETETEAETETVNSLDIKPLDLERSSDDTCGCSPTPSGQSCC